MEKISRKNWALIWVLGMAGQICWNIENSWFNTFVYRKIAPDPSIVAWMVGVSAVVSTFCTFLIGTASDRLGRRRPFIAFGYILWGVFTIEILHLLQVQFQVHFLRISNLILVKQ